jgi:peptidoglycan/LPS O-acetylase OafA/YrhL
MYLIEHNHVQSRLGWIAIGLGLASLSYYLVEQPCLRRLRWNDKYPTTVISGDAKTSFLQCDYLVDAEHHVHANSEGGNKWT